MKKMLSLVPGFDSRGCLSLFSTQLEALSSQIDEVVPIIVDQLRTFSAKLKESDATGKSVRDPSQTVSADELALMNELRVRFKESKAEILRCLFFEKKTIDRLSFSFQNSTPTLNDFMFYPQQCFFLLGVLNSLTLLGQLLSPWQAGDRGSFKAESDYLKKSIPIMKSFLVGWMTHLTSDRYLAEVSQLTQYYSFKNAEFFVAKLTDSGAWFDSFSFHPILLRRLIAIEPRIRPVLSRFDQELLDAGVKDQFDSFIAEKNQGNWSLSSKDFGLFKVLIGVYLKFIEQENDPFFKKMAQDMVCQAESCFQSLEREISLAQQMDRDPGMLASSKEQAFYRDCFKVFDENRQSLHRMRLQKVEQRRIRRRDHDSRVRAIPVVVHKRKTADLQAQKSQFHLFSEELAQLRSDYSPRGWDLQQLQELRVSLQDSLRGCVDRSLKPAWCAPGLDWGRLAEDYRGFLKIVSDQISSQIGRIQELEAQFSIPLLERGVVVSDMIHRLSLHPELKRIADAAYRLGAKFGDGGTAYAIAYERVHSIIIYSHLAPRGHEYKGRWIVASLEYVQQSHGAELSALDFSFIECLRRDLDVSLSKGLV